MSDPVTNVEIEDVLSSIRRLVSSDERPKSVSSVQPAPEPAPAPAEPERLVLTPSLRVDDAVLDLSGHALAVETDDEETADVADISSDAVAALDGDPDVGENSGTTAEQAAIPAQTREVDEATNGQPVRDPKAELKARVAELEEVVSRQGDQWDPDGASPDANSGSPVASLPWEDYVSGAEEEKPQDASTKTADPAPEFQHRAPESKPDTSSDADTGDSRNDFAADGISEPSASPGDSARDFVAASDEFLDEDALRDLVADIVRQELQGALGERITRNVRKLVRREIHRALTSQELQ